MFLHRKETGQSVVEYAILIGIVIAVLGAMQLYAKRGLQAIIKDSADQIGSQADSQPSVTTVVSASESNITTLSSDTVTKWQNQEERGSEFDSVSSSSGESISVTNAY